MDQLQTLIRIGNAVEKRWKRLGFSERDFPDLAESILIEFSAHEQLDPDSLISLLLRRQLTSDQYGYPFSDLQIKLFEAESFYIEVLFWQNGTTSIHDHLFSGAFTLLSGQSVHSIFHFEEKKKVRDGFQLGTLHTQNVELLSTGDIRRIRAGRAFIHSVFHLNTPSVSLLIRTKKETASLPQLDYRRPGIAIEPGNMTKTLKKQLEALRYQYHYHRGNFRKMLKTWSKEATPEEIYRTIDHLSPFAHQDKDLITALLDLASRTPCPELLKQSLWAKLEENALIGLRGAISCQESRLILGASLVADSAPAARSVLQSALGRRWQQVAARVVVQLEHRGYMACFGPVMAERLSSIANH